MAQKKAVLPAEKAPVLTAVPDWADAGAIGALVGLSERRIQQLARSGVLETEAPPGRRVKKYPTCKTIQRYIAHVRQKAQDDAGEATELESLSLKKLKAEVELKESQSELHRLKTAIAAGKYVDTERAGQELAEFLRTFRQFALDMPGRAVRSMPGQLDTVTARAMEKAMRAELEAMLNTFADAVMVLGGRENRMKSYTHPPISAPPWVCQAVESLRPRPHLPASQWAERYRVLPSGNAIPGPWCNRVTPYLTEIMDAFTSGEAEKIIFIKPSQIGGTSAFENILGCVIDQEPAPAMVVYPSDDLAERTVEARLEPMIRSCPPLREKFRAADSKKLRLKFEDMTIYLNGANSPADLASANIRYLFLDEVDKYPGASKKEADPVSLAIERTKTYTTNRKIFITSTPTVKTGYIWRAKEAADQERHYFVPCPLCGQYIELVMAQLKWPGKDVFPDRHDRAARDVYICQSCGGTITDRHKGAMLQAGRWQTVRGTARGARSVAYWLSTLYSPFTSFSEIALEKMLTRGDPERAQNFANSWLAEPWEPAVTRTSADLVLERRTEVPEFVVPEWTKLLTGGVDVQEGSFYWTIRAWGPAMTSQNVAHGQTLTFDAVDRIMNLTYAKASGEKMLVNLALVDSGDQTDMVYEFCMRHAEWALPSKGVAAMQGGSFRISTINKAGSQANGMRLVLVDGGKYKDMIAARMRRGNGPGSWMVHKDCDLDYAEQVTAEEKALVSSGGKQVQRWVLKSSHAANHYLDCEVYAAAAADILDVRTLGFEEQKESVDALAPAAVSPEEEWIRRNEDWI